LTAATVDIDLQYNINLIIIALSTLYPEVKWVGKEVKPRHYWSNIETQRTFFDKLAIKLNITKPEEWFGVSCKDVLREGGTFITRLYRSSVVRGKEWQWGY
jgi:hypothetical protein